MAQLGAEYSQLSAIAALDEERSTLQKMVADLNTVIAEEKMKGDVGNEMVELAQVEMEEKVQTLIEVEEKILAMLIPKDDADQGDAILEVRAGTGKA